MRWKEALTREPYAGKGWLVLLVLPLTWYLPPLGDPLSLPSVAAASPLRVVCCIFVQRLRRWGRWFAGPPLLGPLRRASRLQHARLGAATMSTKGTGSATAIQALYGKVVNDVITKSRVRSACARVPPCTLGACAARS